MFKIDWALAKSIPFAAEACRQAGPVHLGGTLAEIAAGERASTRSQHPAQPFVLLAQQSQFDPSRAPAGGHTAWAYCHVPNGSRVDMTTIIERQVERFAPRPRFRERVLARHTFDTAQLDNYHPDYVGGDIKGGLLNISQLFTRPVLRALPYRTSQRGLCLCSSAAPPGGHGLCGYYAARRALRDVFRLPAPPLHAGS